MYFTHRFMGHSYEVVNGSKRDTWFKRARIAAKMGFDDIATHYHLEGIRAPGCARAHRLGVRHG